MIRRINIKANIELLYEETDIDNPDPGLVSFAVENYLNMHEGRMELLKDEKRKGLPAVGFRIHFIGLGKYQD
jgi:hypothetical protein